MFRTRKAENLRLPGHNHPQGGGVCGCFVYIISERFSPWLVFFSFLHSLTYWTLTRTPPAPGFGNPMIKSRTILMSDSSVSYNVNLGPLGRKITAVVRKSSAQARLSQAVNRHGPKAAEYRMSLLNSKTAPRAFCKRNEISIHIWIVLAKPAVWLKLHWIRIHRSICVHSIDWHAHRNLPSQVYN